MIRERVGRLFALAVLVGSAGCSIGPRRFADLTNTAPLVRARAAQLGDNLPESAVIPALIERLNDPDPVVQLSAHEELRKRTGQDFGFRPWQGPAERGKAVARWRSWWLGRRAGLAKFRGNG